MQGITLLALTAIAQAAITRGQPVNVDGSLTADGTAPLGVAAHDAVVGEELAVAVLGTAPVLIASGTVTEGSALKVASGGFTVAAAGDVIVGTALTAGGAGALVEALLLPQANA